MAHSEKSDMMSKVGVWSYVAGLVIAAIIGLAATFGSAKLVAWQVIVLAALGIVVGLLNISDDEIQMFLLASLAFVISSMAMGTVFQALGTGWLGIQLFMNCITVFTAPGALVVAFKALYKVAKDE